MNVASLIVTALSMLDTGRDDLWTGDGLPRIEAVQANVDDIVLGSGVQAPKLNRKLITDAAPLFTRSNPELPPGGEGIESADGGDAGDEDESDDGDGVPVLDPDGSLAEIAGSAGAADATIPLPAGRTAPHHGSVSVLSAAHAEARLALESVDGVEPVIDGAVADESVASANNEAVARLNACLASLNASMEQFVKEQRALGKSIDTLRAMIDRVEKARLDLRRPPSAAEAIQQYQRRQHEINSARVGANRLVPGVDFRPRQTAPRVPPKV